MWELVLPVYIGQALPPSLSDMFSLQSTLLDPYDLTPVTSFNRFVSRSRLELIGVFCKFY